MLLASSFLAHNACFVTDVGNDVVLYVDVPTALLTGMGGQREAGAVF